MRENLCLHWIHSKTGGRTKLDMCEGAMEPQIWRGNPEVLRVSRMEDTFWKDEYVPNGQWRIVEQGFEFIHASCYGRWEMLDDYDASQDQWIKRHTCSKCGKKLDFEII